MAESFDHRPAGGIRQSGKCCTQPIHNHMVVDRLSVSSMNFAIYSAQSSEVIQKNGFVPAESGSCLCDRVGGHRLANFVVCRAWSGDGEPLVTFAGFCRRIDRRTWADPLRCDQSSVSVFFEARRVRWPERLHRWSCIYVLDADIYGAALWRQREPGISEDCARPSLCYLAGCDGYLRNSTRTTRLNLYWQLSGLATLVYLLVVGGLMTVPGVDSATKLLLLSFTGLLLALPLVIGVWKFRESEVPITAWPLGPVVGVILMLQFVLSVAQVLALVRILIRRP
jgi:hypothetical protein